MGYLWSDDARGRTRNTGTSDAKEKRGGRPTLTRRIRVITDNSKGVSRDLVVAREGNERQPGEGTAGGRKVKLG